MNVVYKQVESINEFIDAIRLRIDVFIKEQSFQAGWEPDEDDKTAKHFIAVADGKVVATARFRELSGGEFKIERMVVKKEYRGKGIGEGLATYILGKIIKLRPKRIWARSQVKSQEFYEKCGFKPTSKPFEMWGVPHIDMDYSKL